MQGLPAVAVRTGGANVQTAQFEIRAENGLHTFQHFGSLDNFFEDFAFIHGVGNTPRTRLLFEFAARAVALFGIDFFHAGSETFDFGLGKETGQHQVSPVFKLLFRGIGEHSVFQVAGVCVCDRDRRHSRPSSHPR